MGTFPLVQNVMLKFLLDNVPGLRSAYNRIWFLKLNLDMFALYGQMVMIAVFNERMNEIFVGTWVVTLLIHLISGKKNPMLINFISKPNPNPMVAIKINDKNEITSLRIHTITVSKSICMTLTCIAIMAVDFPPLF